MNVLNIRANSCLWISLCGRSEVKCFTSPRLSNLSNSIVTMVAVINKFKVAFTLAASGIPTTNSSFTNYGRNKRVNKQ